MEQVLQIPSELYGRKKWSYLELRLSFLKLLNNKNFYIELVSSLLHYLIKYTLKEKAVFSKENFNFVKKYECGHFSACYIKSDFYTRLLN